MNFVNRTFEGDVPKLTKWLYTSSGMFRDALYQFVAMFLLVFVQYCALGNTTIAEYNQMYLAITAIIIVLRIWDGINDPIMGWIVERCHFKMGKYRPWILIGAVLNSVVTICMFNVLPSGWAYVACFAVFYFLWDFTYTMNDIAFWSVLPSLSNKEKVRANLTTLLSVFISVGTFAVGGAIPMLASGNQEQVYRITSIVLSIMFAISQIILVVFMKEKAVDPNVKKNDENMKLREIFTVMFKNKQLLVIIVAILLFYTGANVLVAGGLNYFYFNYGYQTGGFYQLIFTIVYAVATFIGQAIYPLLVNKLHIKKMTLFSVSSIATVLSYIGLFCFVFFYGHYVQYFPLLCVFAFIAFFGQTIITVVLYIMMQDCIDYNELKHHERKESAISSLRAFTAKMASSIQQGVFSIFLFASGLTIVSQTIANAERDFHKGIILEEELWEIANGVTVMEGTAQIPLEKLVIFQIGFTIVPMILFLITFILVRSKYKISETKHEEIVAALETRKEGKEVQNLDSLINSCEYNSRKQKALEAAQNRFRNLVQEEIKIKKDELKGK